MRSAASPERRDLASAHEFPPAAQPSRHRVARWNRSLAEIHSATQQRLERIGVAARCRPSAESQVAPSPSALCRSEVRLHRYRGRVGAEHAQRVHCSVSQDGWRARPHRSGSPCVRSGVRRGRCSGVGVSACARRRVLHAERRAGRRARCVGALLLADPGTWAGARARALRCRRRRCVGGRALDDRS